MEHNKLSKIKKNTLWLLVSILVVAVLILFGLIAYILFEKKENNIEISASTFSEQYNENDIIELFFSYETSKEIEYIFIELEYSDGLEIKEVSKDETEEYLYSNVEREGNKFYFYFDTPTVMGGLGNFKFNIKNINLDLFVGIKKGYIKYMDGTFSFIENEPISLNSNNGGYLYICSNNENYYNHNIKNHYYSFDDETENYQECKKSNITFEKGYSIINDIKTKEIVVLKKDNKMYFYNVEKEKFIHEFDLPSNFLLVDSLYIDSNTGYTYGFSLYFNNEDDENSVPKTIYYDLNSNNYFEMKYSTLPTVASSPNIVETQYNKLAYSRVFENFEEKIGIYDLNNNEIILPNKYDKISYNEFDEHDGYYIVTLKGEKDKIYFPKTKELIEMPTYLYWIINQEVVSYAQNEKLYISYLNNINSQNYLLVIDDINVNEIMIVDFVNYNNQTNQYEVVTEKSNFIRILTNESNKIYDIQNNKLVTNELYE